MKIHAMLHGSRANGPGLRSVVWFQGCVGMNCPGCQNPKTHSPTVGREIGPQSLAAEIFENAARGTEGLTLSGGEPLQQNKLQLLDFLVTVKTYFPRLSVGLFTGYTEAELDVMPYCDKIRLHLDWYLAGRWDRTAPAPVESFGPSTNQKLVILRRYTPADFTRMVEYSIEESGLTQVTGFPGRS